MPKLTTRQIVIIGIAVIALIYGGYDLFFARSKKIAAVDAGRKIEDLNAFMTDMTLALAKDAASPLDAHLIKRAEAAWERDPFYDRKTEKAWAVPKPAATAGGLGAPTRGPFSYTGYVEAGKKKIAVINGHEYGVGDMLDVEGYILKGISPAWITVYNRETRRTTDIPLQE